MLDQTGDARGVGGDRKHANWLKTGIAELEVEVFEGSQFAPTSKDWLVVADLFVKSSAAEERIASWPGPVCQLLLCKEENYGRSRREYRARAGRMLDRANLIVQTGPFTERLGRTVTLPYVPWRPEPELLAIDRFPEDAPMAGFLVTGTLRAGKGQREFARHVAKISTRPSNLFMLGNSVMWFSEDLRQLLLRETPEAREDEKYWIGSWLTRTGEPRKTKRERPWRIELIDRSISYDGAYRGVADLAAYLQAAYDAGLCFMHVNPSLASWSPGHLEYTTLEALAAGLRVGLPSHVDVDLLYPGGVTLEEATKRHDPVGYAQSLVNFMEDSS